MANGLFVGTGKLVVGLLSFTALLTAARLLQPAEYGRLSLVLVSSSVLYAVLASWSSLPVYVLAAEELRDYGTMAQTSAARLLLTGAVTLGVGSVMLVATSLGLLEGIDRFLIVGWAVAGVGYTACEHVTSLLETRGSFAGSVAVQVLRSGTWALGLLALAISATRGLDPVLWVLVISWVMPLGLAIVLAIRLPLRPVRTSRRQVVLLARAASPLIVYSVSQLVLGSVDLYVLRFFATTHQVGVYGLAYQCFSMGALLSSAVVVVMTPRLAGHVNAAAAATVYFDTLERRGLPILSAVVAALVPWVVPVSGLLFGNGYREVGPPLVVLSLAFLVILATTALAPVLLVRRRHRLMAGVAVAAVVLNTALDLVLIGGMRLGITAPAVATLVALTLAWVLFRHRMSHELRMRPVLGVAVVLCPPAVSAVASLMLPLGVASTVGVILAVTQVLVLAAKEGGLRGSSSVDTGRSSEENP